jgi:hypothetical protein
MAGEHYLEVTLSNYRPFPNNAKSHWRKVDLEDVPHLDEEGKKEIAYSIEANIAYKLNLKTDMHACAKEQWFFKLKRGVASCEDKEVHEKRQGTPELWVATDRIQMVSRDMNTTIQMEGGEHARRCTTITVDVDATTGCKVCDAFFVHVSYYPCCEDSDYEMRLPLVLKSLELRR